jgi:ribonucleoside-diphosphate reductase alpha chain
MADDSQNQLFHAMKRLFTVQGESPWESVSWESRTVELRNALGHATFSQDDVEVPAQWSETAATVVASTYFHGEPGTAERESSIRSLIARVVGNISDWGLRDGYFDGQESARTFEDELTYALLHQHCSFNSPVWFNVGHEEHPQCSACFIFPVEDTLESLLKLQQTEARLFKYGSGAGTNLSSIRSSYEKLDGGAPASGPVSFMKGYDAWASVVKSGGKTRRAAKMQILNIDHPDIIEFIQCKYKEEQKARALIAQGYDSRYEVAGGAYDSVAFQNSNLSVRVSDLFMEAALSHSTYWTKHVLDGTPCSELSARKILTLIAEASHFCGDPGIQFDDTINDWHTCPSSGRINASNPCSEYMHLDNSACNLASINLLHFFQDDGTFLLEEFLHTITLLITAQDILIDRSSYPTEDVQKNATHFRQLGLGYSNLGATLMALGLPYDSEEGRALAAALTALLCGQAYLTSVGLSSRLGTFSGYPDNKNDMLEVIEKHARAAQDLSPLSPDEIRSTAQHTWEQVKVLGDAHGFRNSQATAIAPTGTISFMMDCDTTGIEPDLALRKTKHLADGGSLTLVNASVSRALRNLQYSPKSIEQIVQHINEHGSIENAPTLKPEHLSIFDCALQPPSGSRSIHYSGHIKMMAAVQPFLSGAISKTVNLPKNISIDEVAQIYIDAWQLGLKSLAVYRDSSKLAQPLSTGDNVNEDGSISYLACPIEGGCG